MLYDYECPACGFLIEISKKLKDFDRVEPCPDCGYTLRRRLTLPAVVKDYAAYNCPITGKRIEGRREHFKNLEKHNCRLQEPGEVEELVKRKAKQEEQFIERVGDQAVEVFQNMPVQLRDRVAGELVQGAEIPFIRV